MTTLYPLPPLPAESVWQLIDGLLVADEAMATRGAYDPGRNQRKALLLKLTMHAHTRGIPLPDGRSTLDAVKQAKQRQETEGDA